MLFRIGTQSLIARVFMSALAALAPLLMASAHANEASDARAVTDLARVIADAADDEIRNPTESARLIAVLSTAMYDAWAISDPRAHGVVIGAESYAAPATSRDTLARMAQAVRALLRAEPARTNQIDAMIARHGLAAGGTTMAEAEDIARRVRQHYANDGADRATRDFIITRPRITDWLPIETPDGRTQRALTPGWGQVRGFAIGDAALFRAPPPPRDDATFNAMVDDIINVSANLTDQEKATAEYWVPWGGWPASHMMRLSADFADRRGLGLDDTVKLLFAAAMSQLDAGIVCWETKYAYNYARPVTAVRARGDALIRAWTPRGVREMRARDFDPYLPTPPFPAYTSGHALFTSAWARVMELVTGSSALGLTVRVTRLEREVRDLPAPITLSYPTFMSAADASGISRIYGGIHWRIDDTQGRAQGAAVGDAVFARASALFAGQSPPPPSGMRY